MMSKNSKQSNVIAAACVCLCVLRLCLFAARCCWPDVLITDDDMIEPESLVQEEISDLFGV